VALSGAGTVASPFVADGLSMVISTPAGAVAGDRFLIRPTRDAVNGMSTLITDAGRFAAAAPITASRNTSNTGGGTISAGEVLDPTNAQLRSTVNIQFLTASTYSVNGAGSFAYTAGQPIDLNGWRVTISGAPAVGDQFSVRDNSSGIGDNRNVLALGRSLNTPRLENSTTSVNAATARLAGTVGHFAQQSQVNRDAQQIMQDDSITLRQNAMGVNLDEEAANLIRYQQAYQAAAQLIKVANQMFDAVLAATR
jgi:flagellar hook-associated protein 1 FlgK